MLLPLPSATHLPNSMATTTCLKLKDGSWDSKHQKNEILMRTKVKLRNPVWDFRPSTNIKTNYRILMNYVMQICIVTSKLKQIWNPQVTMRKYIVCSSMTVMICRHPHHLGNIHIVSYSYKLYDWLTMVYDKRCYLYQRTTNGNMVYIVPLLDELGIYNYIHHIYIDN